jgi:hypothetical protein
MVCLGILASSSTAQLPSVPVPSIPVPAVPDLPGATRTLGGTLRELSGARQLRVERLLRDHRAELDRDPRGELVVRAEVVAIDITQAALDRALAARFLVLRTTELEDLGFKLTILQTPEGMSAARGLRRLRKMDPDGVYDFNHVYLDGAANPTDSSSPMSRAAPTIAPRVPPAPALRLGLIDGGVDAGHSIFKPLRLHHFGCEGRQVPSAHGTAVASLLAAHSGAGHLYVADVYCGEAAGGAVDSVARALAWMARERVAVINVSLVGPPNALLERAVKGVLARGHAVVAAVGNDGPASPPLYPAAYEGVVGVTGLDARHRVLIEACRGRQVDFAAPGADLVAAANPPDGFAAVRGTSFAAPIVSALLAELQAPDAQHRGALLLRLESQARDLGRPGRDDVYGAGALGPPQ